MSLDDELRKDMEKVVDIALSFIEHTRAQTNHRTDCPIRENALRFVREIEAKLDRGS